MKVAADRETCLINVANGRKQSLVGSHTLLPNAIDIDRLEVEVVYLWNLTESKIFNTVYDVAAYISKQKPQTRFLFRDTEILAKSILSLPVSGTFSKESFSSFKQLKTCLN